MDIIKQVDMLTDNIIDMYTPMMDLADMSYDFHHTKGKILTTECEVIVTNILNLITIFMKKTTCVRNKNILKHYYNKYFNLKFANADIKHIKTLDMKLAEDFIPEDVEISIMKISSSFKALHVFISEFDHQQTLISKTIFLESLKKLESCIISMIFILKLDIKMKDVLIDLEGVLG